MQKGNRVLQVGSVVRYSYCGWQQDETYMTSAICDSECVICNCCMYYGMKSAICCKVMSVLCADYTACVIEYE